MPGAGYGGKPVHDYLRGGILWVCRKGHLADWEPRGLDQRCEAAVPSLKDPNAMRRCGCSTKKISRHRRWAAALYAAHDMGGLEAAKAIQLPWEATRSI